MSERPRAMGLDIGDKRIGIAISDPLGLTAVGFETIERKNNKVDVRVIKAIAERHDVRTIVIGLPKNMNGTIGYQAEKVRDFGVKPGQGHGTGGGLRRRAIDDGLGYSYPYCPGCPHRRE